MHEIKNKLLIGASIVGIIIFLGICYFIKKNEEVTEYEDFFEKLENSSESSNTVTNKDKENDIDETNHIQEANKIAIHIAGQVVNPGVIYLNEGARIIDAINEAGGTTRRSGFK